MLQSSFKRTNRGPRVSDVRLNVHSRASPRSLHPAGTFGLAPARIRGVRSGCAQGVELDAENAPECVICERLAPGTFTAHLEVGRLCDEISMVGVSQSEEQLRLMIQPRTNSIHHLRDMLAHRRRI